MLKTVPFQGFQFNIGTLFNSIWPIYRTLSGSTTPIQRGPGIDGSKGVLRIPQNSGIPGTSP